MTRFPLLLTTFLLGSVSPVWAEGSAAGAMLAGFHAVIIKDDEAAARYAEMGVKADPAQQKLLETGIISNLDLVDLDAALEYAEQLETVQGTSPLSMLTILADKVNAYDFEEARAEVEKKTPYIASLSSEILNAWAKAEEKDYEGALAALAEHPNVDYVDKLTRRYNEVLIHAHFGEYEKAYEVILGDDETGTWLFLDTDSAIIRASLLADLGRFDEAVEFLENTFGAAYARPDFVERLIVAFSDKKPNKEASYLDTRRAYASAFLSTYTMMAPNQNASENAFYRSVALNMDPTNNWLILQKGLSEYEEQTPEKAAATFEKVDKKSIYSGLARISMASAYLQLDKFDEIEALGLGGRDATVLELATYGDAKRAEEDYNGAVELYDRALEIIGEDIQPANWQIVFSKGIALEQLKRWDEAKPVFLEAMRLSPDNPDVMNYLGYSMIDRKEDLEEAFALIEAAIALEPNNGYIVDSLAWGYYQLGEYEKALEPMERAVSLMSVDSIVNDHMGDVYWKLGREREARYQWKRALLFNPTPIEAEKINNKLVNGLE